MVWQGRPLNLVTDVADAILEIVRGDLPDGARRRLAGEFLFAYRAETGHADTNVAYLTNYFSRQTMIDALRLFGLRHPTLGSPDEIERMTPEQFTAARKASAAAGAAGDTVGQKAAAR